MALSKISYETGRGGMPFVRVKTPCSDAEIYLHGAHVTHFQRNDENPVLFLSREAVFAPGKPIRGGVPVILPWFGPREGRAMHGFARTQAWNLIEADASGEAGARLRFRLPECPEASEWPRFEAEFEVFVGCTLEMKLRVTNVDATQALPLEACLHTYFSVSDISRTEVCGLRGVSYEDSLDGDREKVETDAAIRIDREVDRVYFNSPQMVEIVDSGWRRVIRVSKQNSLSTVVWNPWIAKSSRLPDFGDDEYQRMVCVESGNVDPNQITLPPGKTALLSVAIGCHTI